MSEDLLQRAPVQRVQAALRAADVGAEIIVLKDIQGLPLEEISGMLDLPLGTVKSRSSRARLELARAITDISGGPNGPLGAEALT